MAYAQGSLNSANDAVTLTLQQVTGLTLPDGQAVVTISGSLFTGTTLAFEGLSSTGSASVWTPLGAIDLNSFLNVAASLAIANGTARTFKIPDVRGFYQIRVRASAITLGPCNVEISSAPYAGGGAPIIPFSSTVTNTPQAITSTSANALAVGPAGTTNPSFNVDASTGSAATGLNVKSAAAGAGVALTVISSGTNESETIDAKGSGTITLGSVSTGAIQVGNATNPALKVVQATAGTGFSVTSAAAASGAALAVISSGTNENGTIDAKGSGTLTLNGTGTGAVNIGSTGAPGVLVVRGTLTAGGLLTNAIQVAVSGPPIYSGSGAPTISAAVKGSLYLRTDGTSTSTRAYIAQDTAGTWASLTTSA